MADDPIPAATLIVVREGATKPPQLLMVERAQGMAFAAGALVFPGGRIDQADRDFAAGIGAEPAMVAALRETIEETAVPVGLAPVPSTAIAAEIQDRLIADETFANVLSSHGLTLDLDCLTAFARWVPRFHAVRRFDTLFFIARSPPGEWQARVVEKECAGAFWLSAREALEREASGTAKLIFPTRRTLERLAKHSSFSEILADARAHAIEPITPWLEERNGEKFITIPSHLGFPVTEERLDGLWRG